MSISERGATQYPGFLEVPFTRFAENIYDTLKSSIISVVVSSALCNDSGIRFEFVYKAELIRDPATPPPGQIPSQRLGLADAGIAVAVDVHDEFLDLL
jgi:hypothetical protein